MADNVDDNVNDKYSDISNDHAEGNTAEDLYAGIFSSFYRTI